MSLSQSVVQAKRLEVWTCSPQAALSEVARRMAEEDISCLVVVDDEGYLAGIITRTDLIRAFDSSPDWEHEPVKAFMNRDVVTASPHASLSAVAKQLLEKRIHRVVVTRRQGEKELPMAVVSSTDLIYHMVKNG